MIRKFSKQIEIFLMVFLISGCTFTVGTRTTRTKKDKNYTYHYVRKGENLFRISKYYYNGKNVKEIKKGIERIKKVNNIEKETSIKVGQKLLIPGTYKKQPSYALTPPSEITATKTTTAKSPQTQKENTKEEYMPIVKDKAFIWPVKGDIICKYGEFGNKGIDIEVDPGNNVVSSAAGTVIFTGLTAKYQETIIIQHTDNLRTIYGHDIEILVKNGEKVKKGQVIGKIKSGTQKKRYLHFEIRINENTVNPLNYLPEK